MSARWNIFSTLTQPPTINWIRSREHRGGPLYRTAKQRLGRADFYFGRPGPLGLLGSHAGSARHVCRYLQLRALVEVASNKCGFSSEPSYGTHFFQDLVESQIYPLAIHPDEPGDHLNWDFLKQSENQIPEFIPEQTKASRCVKVIHIPTERPGYHMEIVMDGQSGLGYLTPSKVKQLIEDPHQGERVFSK